MVAKVKAKINTGGKSTFTVQSVLESFKDTSEYGASFRSMTSDTQAMEVLRLNKGAASGMKVAIRKQRIDVQFKTLVSERMKEFLIQNRTEPLKMFRAITQPRNLQRLHLRFLSIGEWVEVDADRTPGWNSEGGIAVIVNVNDSLADVKYDPPIDYFTHYALFATVSNRYVLTRWVEKLVPLRRLTTIIMPHRDKMAGLRPRADLTTLPTEARSTKAVSEFRTMSAIAALKYGLTKKLYRSSGWLYRLLVKEGSAHHDAWQHLSQQFITSPTYRCID